LARKHKIVCEQTRLRAFVVVGCFAKVSIGQTCATRGPHCGPPRCLMRPNGIVHDLEIVFQMNYIPQVFVLFI